MMVGGIDGFGSGLAWQRPEYAALHHVEVAGRQSIIDSQAGVVFGREIRRYARRIAVMLYELIGMLLNDARATFTRRNE